MSCLQTIAVIVFWLAALLLFQSYLGILLSLLVVNTLKRKPEPVEPDSTWELPDITVLIPARNEEEVIAVKIRNLLAQDYPENRLRIYVVSDCSTDGTVDIVKGFADRGVNLIELTERHGKLGIIDKVIPGLPGDILVITDANVILAVDAMKVMMREYADPDVGAVCGDLPLVAPSGGKNMRREATYRHYEIVLKRLMGKLGAVIGAYGGFYSQRRHLFRPLGERPIHDDVIMPLEVLAQGFKVIYARQASAVEETHPTIAAEYVRRVRMTAFNLNTIPRMLRLAWKAGFKVFYLVFSYKLCRWLSPYLFALMFLSSLLLIGASNIYNLVAFIFMVSLLLVVIGWLRDRFGAKQGGVTTDLYHFAAMNFAAFAGIGLWLKGVEKYWEPRGM